MDTARRWIELDRYAAADSLCCLLLDAAERRYGRESLAAADVIEVLAEARYQEGLSGEAATQELARRGVSIRERKLGPRHRDVAASLDVLGQILVEAGDYAGAASALERALGIREASFGPDHPEVGRTLAALGTLANATGDFKKALAYAERAQEIHVRSPGADSQDYADALDVELEANAGAGDYARAAAIGERALAIRERHLPPDDPKLAWARNNLATVCFSEADFARARPLYEQALASLERTLGPEHPDVGRTLTLLANTFCQQADFPAARPLYERALAIQEKTLGPDHPAVANSLHNLAVLLCDMGDYREALAVAQRAMAAKEKNLGPDHPEVALTAAELGREYHYLGDETSAQEWYRRSLTIREKALGADHPYVALSQQLLSRSYLVSGELGPARTYAESALAILQHRFGPDHPSVGTALYYLAGVVLRGGEPEEATTIYRRSLAILEQAYGPAHRGVQYDEEALGRARLAVGDLNGALDAELRADSIARVLTRTNLPGLPERQALRYAAEGRSARATALSLAVREPAPTAVRRVWDSILRARGEVLEEMADRQRALVGRHDPALAALADSLAEARRVLSTFSTRGSSGASESFRHDLDSLARALERLETRVARSSAEFCAQLQRRGIGLDDVARSLPGSSALVAYAVYAVARSEVDPADPSKVPRSLRDTLPAYAAFVLRAGESDPTLVPLGSAARIDSLFGDWRRSVTPGPIPPGRPGDDAICRRRGKALRQAVWDPLQPRLAGVTRIFVVPDGALQTLNLAALPVGKDRYLIETRPVIHELSTERDLVPDSAATAPGRGLLAMGDPDFDFALPGAPLLAAAAGANGTPYRGNRSSCGDFATLRWERLPGTAAEVREVAALWQAGSGRGASPAPADEGAGEAGDTLVLTGSRATVSALIASAPTRRVIHLATHGFFLASDCATGTGPASSPPAQGGAARGPGAPAENPLLRSGLVLSGANQREATAPVDDDGILTGAEIASLDLSGVEWVVLSACETGGGTVAVGEGVFGLRRTLEIAGARTVIMSLWPVEDEAAREWMVGLYRSRFEQGLPTDEAVRRAGLDMLLGRRRHHQSTHPFFWGAFVAAGRPE